MAKWVGGCVHCVGEGEGVGVAVGWVTVDSYSREGSRWGQRGGWWTAGVGVVVVAAVEWDG